MINRAVLQSQFRNHAINLAALFGPLAYLAIVAGELAVGIGSTTGLVAAQLASSIVILALTLQFTRDSAGVGFHKGRAKALLRYGVRAYAGTIQPVDTLRIDQLLLSLFLSSYLLGIYVTASTFVTANLLIGYSVGLIAFPIASHMDSAPDRDDHLRKLVIAAFALAVSACAMEAALGKFLLTTLLRVNDPKAYQVMVILSIGSIFMVLRRVLSDILRGMGNPGIASIAEVLMMLVLVASSIFLWRYGVVGVALAVCGSAAVALIFEALWGVRSVQGAKPIRRVELAVAVD
jgi:O-antigen/teichoic acid export membrane protein